MSRQLLLNEIERIYLESDEKEEDMTNEAYVFSKYPHLASLFEQFRFRNEKWHQLVREVLPFYTKNNLRYMYDRTMQLLRRFLGDVTPYFDVKTETGTYTLPDRLSDLNRLLVLYSDFFTSIYPNISRKLRFDTYSQEQDSRMLRGQVLWPRTIRQCISQGGGACPTSFVALVQEYGFETPENILTILSVSRLRQDSLFLLGYNFQDRLITEERVILRRVVDGCENILKTTLLKKLIPMATKYVTLSFEDPRILSLEAQSYARLRGERRENNPYFHLLQWRQKYRELNLRSVSPNRTNFPIDRLQNLDTMYEVWTLFEFLDYLQTHGKAAIDTENFPQRIAVLVHGVDMDLFYEKEYKGWASGARPDFSIERDGKLKIIMDAKNWLQSKGEAIYKMLGYLNNLDGTIGILFFPNERSLGDKRISEGLNLKHHQNQLLYNCVVKPSSDEEAVHQKQKAFEQIMEIVLQNIN